LEKEVLDLSWDYESFATLEKINLLAMWDVKQNFCFAWLSLMEASKIIKAQFGLVRSDNEYRSSLICNYFCDVCEFIFHSWIHLLCFRWVPREVMFMKIEEKAQQYLFDFTYVPEGVSFPVNVSLSHYFESIKLEARKFLFVLVCKSETKATSKLGAKKIDHLYMAGQRLDFRCSSMTMLKTNCIYFLVYLILIMFVFFLYYNIYNAFD